MDYSRVCDHVFYCELDDLDLDVLERRGVSYKAYFPEADDLAKFILMGEWTSSVSASTGRAAVPDVQLRFWNIFIIREFRFLPITNAIPIRWYIIRCWMHWNEMRTEEHKMLHYILVKWNPDVEKQSAAQAVRALYAKAAEIAGVRRRN